MTTIRMYPVRSTATRAKLAKPVHTETTEQRLTVEEMGAHLGQLVADQTHASGRRELQFWKGRPDGTGFLTVVEVAA